MVSIPLTIPMSSLGSCIRFCISFMESIMRDMNSRDFSVKLAVPSFLDLWGPAASLVVSAFYFGNVVSLQLQSLGVLQPPLWWSQPPFVPHWVWGTAVLLPSDFPKLKHVLEVSCFLPSAFLNRFSIPGFLEVQDFFGLPYILFQE